MINLIKGRFKLQDSQGTLLEKPLAIGISYGGTRSYSSVSYLMPGYTRPIAIDGVKNETIFWEYCKPCSLYQRRECSGGYRVLNSMPGSTSVRLNSEVGTSQNKHYNKEFCKMHYGDAKLYQDLSRPGVVEAPLDPHLFVYTGRALYWYLYRVNEETNNLEFLPYQIFNTYDDGKICYGGGLILESSQISDMYESFFQARFNTDLMPVSNMSLVDWIRNFNPDKLITRGNNQKWEDAQYHLGTEQFDIIPTTFKECQFARVPLGDIPDEISLTPTRETSTSRILAFVKNASDEWAFSKNLNFKITANSAPAIYTALTNDQ